MKVNALAGAVLVVFLAGVAALAAVVYRPEGTKVDFASLQPGQCFNRGSLGRELVQLRAVSCGHSHHHEVFGVFHFAAPGGTAFPGRDAIQRVASTTCGPALDTYLGAARLPPGLSFGFVYPEQERWDTGERTIVCEVSNTDGSSRNRSIRTT